MKIKVTYEVYGDTETTFFDNVVSITIDKDYCKVITGDNFRWCTGRLLFIAIVD